jgi:hypothetical protein
VPFTLSHAVVALPFVRTPLVPAAIAVGAMTPDLPLFVRVGIPSYATTHDPAALGLTALLALALLLVWRCVLRPAARELLPESVARRLPADWDGTAAEALRETFGVRRSRVRITRIVALVVSLLIGIVSHIVWDAFTHEGRLGVDLIPALACAPGAPRTRRTRGAGAAPMDADRVVGIASPRARRGVGHRCRRARPARRRVHSGAPGVPSASSGMRRVGRGDARARCGGAVRTCRGNTRETSATRPGCIWICRVGRSHVTYYLFAPQGRAERPEGPASSQAENHPQPHTLSVNDLRV